MYYCCKNTQILIIKLIHHNRSNLYTCDHFNLSNDFYLTCEFHLAILWFHFTTQTYLQFIHIFCWPTFTSHYHKPCIILFLRTLSKLCAFFLFSTFGIFSYLGYLPTKVALKSSKKASLLLGVAWPRRRGPSFWGQVYKCSSAITTEP